MLRDFGSSVPVTIHININGNNSFLAKQFDMHIAHMT